MMIRPKPALFIRKVLSVITFGSIVLMPAGSALAQNGAAKMVPETRKADTVHEYHGTKVADPYSWLEDDNSAETKAWVEAQNKVTFQYLDSIPERAKIQK